eukprot:Pgem_evm1s3753
MKSFFKNNCELYEEDEKGNLKKVDTDRPIQTRVYHYMYIKNLFYSLKEFDTTTLVEAESLSR